jgi:predicted acyltransferase
MQENERLISLDAFRGFTIASMIMVNNPGSWSHVYAPLLHKPWHGITPTDLIFPFFIFIVGVSIALAYTKRLASGLPKKDMYGKIVWRSVKIFFVGILLALYSKINNTTEGSAHFLWMLLVIILMCIFVLPEFHTRSRIASIAQTGVHILAVAIILALIVFKFNDLRIAGVLQRIALVFLFCAFLFLTVKWKTQAIIAGSILVLYCFVMTVIPTPGYDKAMLEPGVNMAAWIDSFMTPGSLYHKITETGNAFPFIWAWDPEGLFSTLPALATGITGMLAGTLLVSKKSIDQKIIWLLVAGFISATAGVVWSWWFPLNKPIWTSSYVLATSGLASMTLGCSMWLVDVLGYKKYAKPWVIFGSNAIGVYVLAGLLGYLFYGGHFNGTSLKTLFMNLFTGMGIEPKFVSLIAALLYIGILFIPAWILYRKKIFIKL